MNCSASQRQAEFEDTPAEHRMRTGCFGQHRLPAHFQIDHELPEVFAQQLQPRIAASLQYILRNLDKPVSVSTLSEIAELSPSAFFLSFKRATGQPPIAFLIRARIKLAVKLLEQTNLQIKQIAALVGYDDEFHFSRRFKSVIGIAPRHYRIKAVQKTIPALEKTVNPIDSRLA